MVSRGEIDPLKVRDVFHVVMQKETTSSRIKGILQVVLDRLFVWCGMEITDFGAYLDDDDSWLDPVYGITNDCGVMYEIEWTQQHNGKKVFLVTIRDPQWNILMDDVLWSGCDNLSMCINTQMLINMSYSQVKLLQQEQYDQCYWEMDYYHYDLSRDQDLVTMNVQNKYQPQLLLENSYGSFTLSYPERVDTEWERRIVPFDGLLLEGDGEDIVLSHLEQIQNVTTPVCGIDPYDDRFHNNAYVPVFSRVIDSVDSVLTIQDSVFGEVSFSLDNPYLVQRHKQSESFYLARLSSIKSRMYTIATASRVYFVDYARVAEDVWSLLPYVSPDVIQSFVDDGIEYIPLSKWGDNNQGFVLRYDLPSADWSNIWFMETDNTSLSSLEEWQSLLASFDPEKEYDRYAFVIIE